MLKLCSYRLETCVSGNLSSFLKEVRPLVVYDGEQGIALEPMQGNRVKSRLDLHYHVLFHIPAVTSVSFKTCEGVPGYSLEFHQAN